MTRKDILELSAKLSQAEDYYNALETWNTALDPPRKLAQDARYRLAASWVERARNDYNAAMASLSATQLEQLAKGEEI